MQFLGEDYLLAGEAAKLLYEAVRDLPLVDPHNHGDVEEILENEGWTDIWEVEAATDHYVWELMRRRGVPEEEITGQASNYEKWLALAEIFPELIGNPTYEWIHLDLKRRFGIEEIISGHTADKIWETTKTMLDRDEMKPQRLLRDMNVQIMCTTDEATSDLAGHQRAREEVEGIEILPTWRPDKLMNIDSEGWRANVEELGQAMDEDVSSLAGFLSALEKSHDHFDSVGCRASDHGVLEPCGHRVDTSRAAEVYEKALAGKELAPEEVRDYRAFVLHTCGELNRDKGWVMQLHIGAVRDYRWSLYESLGADSGGDLCTSGVEVVENLEDFLNAFDDELKLVVYYLDPVHLPALTTLARAFPNMSLGAPWWFNDSPYGMEQHLRYISTVDLLWNHAGMVSDSRKLMSYGSRNEMFRRVLSSVLGEMVDKGQMPFAIASELAESQSYYRPLELFFGGE